MRIIAQMQIYQGFESKIKIALKMGKTILSAITESERVLKAYNNGQFELLGTF